MITNREGLTCVIFFSCNLFTAHDITSKKGTLQFPLLQTAEHYDGILKAFFESHFYEGSHYYFVTTFILHGSFFPEDTLKQKVQTLTRCYRMLYLKIHSVISVSRYHLVFKIISLNWLKTLF